MSDALPVEITVPPVGGDQKNPQECQETRELVKVTETHRIYRVLDENGDQVGMDEEAIPEAEQRPQETPSEDNAP